MNPEEVKIGLPVTYYSIVAIGKKLDPHETTITSEPWELGHGDWVCRIEGRSGGVSLKHLEPRKFSAQKTAMADPKYIPWLHQLTTLGYEHDVMVESEHAEAVAFLFIDGKSPEEALPEYQDFKRRYQAIKDEHGTQA